MFKLYSSKNIVTIIYSYKILLKHSKYKNVYKVLKKKKSSIMFLRAPKHFKVGKQFIFNYSLISKKVLKINIKNIYYLIHLNPKSLFSLLSIFNKNTLPEVQTTRITTVFYINYYLNGWCFIY